MTYCEHCGGYIGILEDSIPVTKKSGDIGYVHDYCLNEAFNGAVSEMLERDKEKNS